MDAKDLHELAMRYISSLAALTQVQEEIAALERTEIAMLFRLFGDKMSGALAAQRAKAKQSISAMKRKAHNG